ncbi:ribosomal protein S18-alanine N-acetyltransferase [Falsihalocynthiibacter sp. SS001]|uniref:ribosomal protein S18-alanine N-acetyltransferase n=1 Tax=Falsihalocynthiibacter sp. SS001 TaxID=3349698 RepID=UPI0036D2EDB5
MIDALADLHARCFVTPRPWSAAEFSALLDQKHVFLIQHQGGFALGRAVAGEAELLTVAVPPEARRQGTGRTLLEQFEEESRRREATESFLEVATDNHAAIALYSAAGYDDSGRRTKYYRSPNGAFLDALVMRKNLV